MLALVSALVSAYLLDPLLLAVFVVAVDGVPASALFDTASWGLIAGVLVPLIVSVVQQPRWVGRTRTLVGLGGAVVVGLLTCLANGTLDTNPQTVLATIALVMVASAAAYKGFYQPSGVAAKIENATSKTPPSAPNPGDDPGYASTPHSTA